jgi:ParB family transcriptional regulator, chromosome partitioning protein
MIEPRKRTSGLGRGLSALLVDSGLSASTSSPSALTQTLPIARIRPNPKQPRRTFDEARMTELVDSVRLRGILQPILVRPVGTDFEIVAGERRWRAAQAVSLHDIPVVIRDLDDATAFEIALIENIQRSDLNAIEEGEGYRRLVEEFGHTQDALAKLVGKSRSHVANLMRLVDLPEGVRKLVIDGTLSMGHARALLAVDDPAALARRIVREGLSVRQVELLTRDGAPPLRARKRGMTVADADIRALEDQIAEATGLRVAISTAGSAGEVRLAYSSLDQLDMLVERLTR